jgi:hypothetical protein
VEVFLEGSKVVVEELVTSRIHPLHPDCRHLHSQVQGPQTAQTEYNRHHRRSTHKGHRQLVPQLLKLQQLLL